MIDLESECMDDVKRILHQHVPQYEVRVFGSRVTGNAMKYSDLDIAIVAEEDLDWRVLDSLRDAFSLSDLAITVDVVEWKALNPEFRNLIASDSKVIQRPEQQR